MAKRLFLYTICCLIEGLLLPNFLATADKVMPVAISNEGVVETVLLPDPEPKTESVALVPNAGGQTSSAVKAQSKPQVEVAPANSIAVAGRVLEIVKVSDTGADSGNHVNMVGDRYIYGHNYSHIFRGLYNLGKGSVFTVAIDGVSRNYQVRETVYYERLSRYLLKDKDTGEKINMDVLINGRNYKYDMVLTTCAGENDSERLVLFADQI